MSIGGYMRFEFVYDSGWRNDGLSPNRRQVEGRVGLA